MKRLVIYPRTEINWKDMTQSQLLAMNRQRKIKRRGRIHRFVGLWGQAFSISFFEYRHRLLQIAQESWESTGLPVTNELRYDDLVLPVDDDDWFRSDIADYCEFPCKWHMGRFISFKGLKTEIELESGEAIYTNNSCLPAKFIEKGYQRHWTISRHYKELLYPVQEALSFTNKTCTSISAIIHNPFRYDLGTEIDSIPEWSQWAEPFINKTLQLNQEVMNSRTHRYRFG